LKLESKKITITEEALSQEVNGEMVILDLKSESYFGLDEVGTRVWQLLQEHRNVKKVFGIMLGEFDVSEQQLKTDMDNLIDDMMKNGLLQITDGLST